MIFFTELQHLPTFDPRGEYLGRLVDLGVEPTQDSLRIAIFLVRTPQKNFLSITNKQMQSISVRSAQTAVPQDQIRCCARDESLLWVKKDVLDQQIIDVNNRKVVRVNDIDFDIEPKDGHSELRVVAVNVGLSAALRRLLQGAMAKHAIRALTGRMRSKTIPWEFVSLIEPDPSRRVKLRISYERLARLHPADIGDILEELSREERKAVIESFDEGTAARALSEIPTHMQASFLESISTEKAADIVEEMSPDEAADVLQEMPPETSAEVLADMEKGEAREVQGLLGFEENTAGALMTTDFVIVGEEAAVEGAVEALRNFEGPIEAVHVIYLINRGAVLTGAISAARLLLFGPEKPLKELSVDRVISVEAHADKSSVIDLFHKYNLVSLPVVDDKGHLLGVVTADDVIELVVNRR